MFSQTISYSTLAQKELDNYATANPNNPNNLGVFKFSIKEILDSNDQVVMGPNNKPTLYGETDYGSEFALANDLDNSLKIEIPAFVIDALAEDTSGEYYPVIINGDEDDVDGNYVNSFRDNNLEADIDQTFNQSGPNIIERNYDTGRKETQYLWNDEANVINNINADQTETNHYINDNEFEVFKWKGTNGDSYTNHNDITSVESAYVYTNANGRSGFIYTGPDDENEKYEEYTVTDGSSGLKYTENGLEIKQDVTTGNNLSVVNITSSVGTYAEIAEIITPGGMSHIEFNSDQLPPIENGDGTFGNHVFQLTANTTDATGGVQKTFTNGANTIEKITDGVTGLTTIKFNNQLLISNIESIIDAAPRIVKKNALVQKGQDVITSGGLTIDAANNLFNFNSSSIDFKDQYDTVNGETIVPEKGFVKLIDAEPGQYINLESGDIVEFFVRPSDDYLDNHNAEDLFYIDRPVPTSETTTQSSTNDTNTSTSTNTGQDNTGSETVVSSNDGETVDPVVVEINYVTTVYVAAPASNFNPTTIVVPVQSDGDYVQEIPPGPAESFPSNIEVVAVPPEEAKRIIKRIEQAKKANDEKKKYVRQNERPVMDDELKAAKALNDSIIFAQKSPGILIQNSKQMLTEEFPNLSKEFINFLFNSKNRETQFELLSDPKKYLNDELTKLDELLSKDTFSISNLTPRQLIKFNYLMDIKFADELANAGLPQDITKIIFLNNKVDLIDIINKQSLQKELLPIISMISSKLNEQEKNEFTKNQSNFDNDGSSALFEKKSSKETINKIKTFSSLIDELNNRSFIGSQTQKNIIDQNLPLVEINIKADQNIKEALDDKMNVIKSLNRPYQTKSFTKTLEKFDFEIPEEEVPINIGEIYPVAPEKIEISDGQLVLMAEATEAADNLLNETLDKMLTELGSQAPRVEDSSLFSDATDITNQDKVTNLLQIANERTKVVEDIRAIFQTMGLGS